MQEPDLDKMWRTWIKIEGGNKSTFKSFQDTIRKKLQNILQLQKDGEIDWFYFLFHEKTDDPANLYFDVVFTTDKKEPKDFLPEYCVCTVKIPPMISIDGIDEKILDDEDIKKAWKIIGEQSEFIINMVCSHKNTEISQKQIAQFMHFFMNPLGYGHKSLFFPKAHPNKLQAIISLPSFQQITRILGGELIGF